MKLNSLHIAGFILISSIFLTFGYHYDVFAPTITVSFVSEAIDGFQGFLLLNGAKDIAIAVIGGNTYALVASANDDGVQIMDIATPSAPTPAAAVFSGTGGFTALQRTQGITATMIGGNTYALATSAFPDDGVQIMDIATPSAPTPAAAVFDDAGGFTALDGAQGITTVKIGGNTYALVASENDESIMIIDIATPDPPITVTEGSSESTTLGMGETGSFEYDEMVASTTDTIIIDVTLPAATTGTITVATVSEETVEDGTNLVTALDISGPCADTCVIQFTVPNTILTEAQLTSDTAHIFHDSNADEIIQANEIIPTTRDIFTIPGSTIFTASASFTSKFAVGGIVGASSAQAVAGISSIGGINSVGGMLGFTQNSCDADGFGNNESLKVYEISYDKCEQQQISVYAYTTCGPISLKIMTEHNSAFMGMSSNQPFLNNETKKIVFTHDITEDTEWFNILVKDKRDEFTDKSYTNKCVGMKEFGQATGHTSKQQGTLGDVSLTIPEWIKNNAAWWSQSEIDDETFVSSMQFLIKEGIITVPETKIEQSEISQIPDWVKNNAAWWSQSEIDDETFVSSMQFLIKEGIITVPETKIEQSEISQIPDWVKNNAAWWSQSEIDDETFVSSMQFLIKEGILIT